MYDGNPIRQNKLLKHLISVEVVMSRQEKEKEKWLYPLVAKMVYFFLPSSGPLNSILTRFQEGKAFLIIWELLKNFCFNSAQILHAGHTFLHLLCKTEDS